MNERPHARLVAFGVAVLFPVVMLLVRRRLLNEPMLSSGKSPGPSVAFRTRVADNEIDG